MVSKKIAILFRMVLISGVLLCACQNEGEGKKTGLHVEFAEFDPGKETGSDREEAEQWERGILSSDRETGTKGSGGRLRLRDEVFFSYL